MLRNILTAAVVSVICVMPVYADEDDRQIIVTGEGTVDVVPDVVTIRLGVDYDSETAGEALSGVADRMTAVFSELDRMEVPAADRQTSSLRLDPIRAKRQDNQQTMPGITGYRARNELTITLRDTSQLGGLIDALSEVGANHVSGITFDVADPAATLADARRNAIKDARAKAELYAEAAGVELGRVLTISDSQQGYQPRQYAARASMQMDMPVAEGTIGISAQVNMVFGIE